MNSSLELTDKEFTEWLFWEELQCFRCGTANVINLYNEYSNMMLINKCGPSPRNMVSNCPANRVYNLKFRSTT